MSHKVVKVIKGTSYARTDVPLSRSIDQIKVMLEKRECQKIAEMRDSSGTYPLYTLVFEHRGVSYIIEFPVTIASSAGGQSEDLNMNISGRIIHDRIKALLIAVDIDYLSFSQAMVECLAVRGSEGMIPLSQHIEECADQLPGGFDIRMCLPGGNCRGDPSHD